MDGQMPAKLSPEATEGAENAIEQLKLMMSTTAQNKASAAEKRRQSSRTIDVSSAARAPERIFRT